MREERGQPDHALLPLLGVHRVAHPLGHCRLQERQGDIGHDEGPGAASVTGYLLVQLGKTHPYQGKSVHIRLWLLKGDEFKLRNLRNCVKSNRISTLLLS